MDQSFTRTENAGNSRRKKEEEEKEEKLEQILNTIDHTDYVTGDDDALSNHADSQGIGRKRGDREYSTIVEDRREASSQRPERDQDISVLLNRLAAETIHFQPSPPKDIKTPEKTAELFPSESRFDFEWQNISKSSCSGSSYSFERGMSKPSSVHSVSFDIPMFLHSPIIKSRSVESLNLNYKEFPYSRNRSTESLNVLCSSLDLVSEQSRRNSAHIETVRKGHCKHAIRMNQWKSTFEDRFAKLEATVEEMRRDLEMVVRHKRAAAMEAGPGMSHKKSTALSWIVPYSDLKRCGKKLIPSHPILVTPTQKLQATLYPLGVGAGEGSHLSVSIACISRSNGPVDCTIKVRVENQTDPNEVREKELSFPEESIICKLIPISAVEDPTLAFLDNGVLTLTIITER